MSAILVSEPGGASVETGALVRTRAVPACPLCGASPGMIAHEALEDPVFGSPGTWRMRRCADARCGHHWLDPVPIIEDLPLLYSSYYTHRAPASAGDPGFSGRYEQALVAIATRALGYDAPRLTGATALLSRLLALQPGRRDEALMRLLFLPRVEGGRVLEFGFGDSRTLCVLRDLGWKVTGVEFDPVAVAQARAAGIEALSGSLEDQPLPEAAFDAGVAGHVIEHLADPNRTLAAARRILKPGGRMILVTPNAASLGHRWYGADWRGLEPPRHLNLFTRASLAALAERMGFEIESNRGSRRAQGILRASRAIRLSRLRGGQPSDRISPGNRLGFELLEIALALWTRIVPDACEEIVLVARRPAATGTRQPYD